MLLLYNLALRFYFFLIMIAAFFNKKAKLWLEGRKKIEYQQFTKSAWFHFASLGEFEQGLPVLASCIKASKNPGQKIVVTFFAALRLLKYGKYTPLCRCSLLSATGYKTECPQIDSRNKPNGGCFYQV